MPTAVHQLVHTLNYGDAISGEALLIQRLMRERGIESEIFVMNANERVRQFSRPWTDFPRESRRRATEQLVLHHLSLGSPLNGLYRELTNYTRVMVYHNITPETWFQGYNTRVARDVREGRGSLPEFVALSDILLADSTYNAEELRACGAKDVGVLPLPIDLQRFSEPANPGIRRILRGHGGKNLLHVGRRAPNKRLEDCIKAFYFYHHKIDQSARLWLVGSDVDTEIYTVELRRLITELRLKDVVSLVGAVADSELRAFYENSDLYLCMSEHEGFCVPVVEAMHFGVPVVAYASCAVPETVGAGALLIQRKDPALTAELIQTVFQDSTLREKLIQLGHERIQSFSEGAFRAALEAQLLQVGSQLQTRLVARGQEPRLKVGGGGD